MVNRVTYSGRPWAHGERCDVCGCRIDSRLVCSCADVLSDSIDEMHAQIVALKCCVDRLKAERDSALLELRARRVVDEWLAEEDEIRTVSAYRRIDTLRFIATEEYNGGDGPYDWHRDSYLELADELRPGWRDQC